MSRNLSPKEVAKAIGVSEASIKRWCDDGVLPVSKTAGGHRRVPVEGVIAWLRSQGRTAENPALLGLPVAHDQKNLDFSTARELLYEMLTTNREETCRQLLLQLFLEHHTLPVLFDEILCPVFEKIGEQWKCGEVEVYRERRCCEITRNVLLEMRKMISASPSGPLAIGGTISADHYILPTLMVELILREQGWHASSLGTSLPMNTLVEAIEQTQPKLFWLSCSHIESESEFLSQYPTLTEATEATGTAIVVGGRALTSCIRQQISYSSYCDTMQQLAQFGKALLP